MPKPSAQLKSSLLADLGKLTMLEYAVEFNYPVPPSGKIIIGTLGPSGTSSEDAVSHVVAQLQERRIQSTVRLFDSFVELKQALHDREVDWAVVPHAYEKINDFYMEPEFDLGYIFIHATPVYGLAQRANHAPAPDYCKVLTHPAPLPLLPKLLPQGMDAEKVSVELVNSTSAAALMVSEGLADFALTNEKAALSHGLKFISSYGRIPMSWSLFHRKDAHDRA